MDNSKIKWRQEAEHMVLIMERSESLLALPFDTRRAPRAGRGAQTV